MEFDMDLNVLFSIQKYFNMRDYGSLVVLYGCKTMSLHLLYVFMRSNVVLLED